MTTDKAQPDAIAFDEFYREHYAPMVRLARLLTGSVPLAEDLVRIDVDSGAETTIVDGDRFLEAADNYPGGFGLAYWRPKVVSTPGRRGAR